MDGTIAALFFVVSIADMVTNNCGGGCLAPAEAERRLGFGAAATFFQDEREGSELFLRYDFGRRYGPFQPVVAGSVTTAGDLWVGAGAAWRSELGRKGGFDLELSVLPGLYARGDGPDLGHPVEIRSAVSLGYALGNGGRVALVVDHRSNADIGDENPGFETVGLQVFLPLR